MCDKVRYQIGYGNAMEIRMATMKDKETVLGFCRHTFSWGDYIGDVWDRWLVSCNLYVLEEDGAIIGAYHIAFPENESWIEGMRVHPRHRRRGLGTKMMSHAESVIKKGRIRLVVESENRPSINLVKFVGYELEEEWRLFLMSPERQASSASVAHALSRDVIPDLTLTYQDSWRWQPLDTMALEKLSRGGRVLAFMEGSRASVGIWNRSEDFPMTFQLGLVGGTAKGFDEILKLAKIMAYSMGCERIQVFAAEKTMVDSPLLEKRSLFYVMKKDLGKIYNL